MRVRAAVIEWHAVPPSFRQTVFESPVGAIQVLYSTTALARAEFGVDTLAPIGVPVESTTLPDWIEDIFRAAFAGSPVPVWPAVDWGFTALERSLLSKASEVLFGTTMSYGALASWAGCPGRARTCGRAMGRSPIIYLIPTHRIIRADGTPAPCQRDPLNDALRYFEGIELTRRHAMIKAPR
jgi:O-6-methylguanine DNA methyltransferase